MADAQVLQLYQGVSSRLIELVRTDPTAGVPSCPEWCALDLLRHVCAVAEDWAEGRLTGYGTQKWTDEGVKRLSDLELDRIADAWRRAITQMADLPDQVGMGDPVRFAFGDAAVHEADLRAALAPETMLPQDALTVATKGSFAVWRQHLTQKNAPPLVVELRDGPKLQIGENPQVTLRISEYELFRMLNGRRSAAQITSYQWSSDPKPYLDIGLGGPVTGGARGRASWPKESLVEPTF